jgi:hypothetical protein
MATAANFAATPRCSSGTLSSAGTIAGSAAVDIFTAGTNGSRVDTVFIKATGSTAATDVVRLAVYDGAWRVIKEISCTAVTYAETPSATVSFEQVVTLGLVLASGQKLQANTKSNAGFNITANGGDF